MVKISDILFLLGAVLAGVGVSLWLAIWSPDALLRDPLPLYRQANVVSAPDATGNRRIDDVLLLGPDGESVRFSVSLPAAMGTEKLPSLIVISPHHDAARNLAQFPRPGANVIVSYAQPYDAAEWKDASAAGRAWIIRNAAYRMPNDVSALIAWIVRQEWADRSRISLAGAGMAAVIVPAVRRRASATGQPIGATVLAFGGVGIDTLTKARLTIEPKWLRAVAAWFAWVMLRPLEPTTHLPEISGPFLLINAKQDASVPRQSLNRLRELTPEPKTIATVDARLQDDPAQIAKTVRLARNWLVAGGFLNP